MRVALASPYPPMSSGIADYVAELLPRLAAEGLELTLFHEGSEAPSALAATYPCRPIDDLRSRRAQFDVVLYQLGNSAPHHAGIYRTLLEVPGVVVLHEFMLHHLVRALTLDARDPGAYLEEMRYCAGESGRRAARRLLDTHHPVDVWSFPLFERVVDRSLAVLVHSEFARARILRSRPRADVTRIPFPAEVAALAPVDAAARAEARAELGWREDELVIGSFGFATPHKRLESVAAACAALGASGRRVRLVICGEVSPHYDLAGRLAEIGARDVEITGRVSLERFHAAMRGCDLAVNLRHPPGGETSASLIRLLALGIPTIVSDAGSFSEMPDGAVAKVAVDEREVRELGEILRRLASDPELAGRIGRAGRRHAEREHDPVAAAGAVRAALERIVAAAPRVEPAVPPLAPWSAPDPRISLIASIGGDWADLGLDEADPALASVAAEIDDLGWSPERGG